MRRQPCALTFSPRQHSEVERFEQLPGLCGRLVGDGEGGELVTEKLLLVRAAEGVGVDGHGPIPTREKIVVANPGSPAALQRRAPAPAHLGCPYVQPRRN